MPDEMFSPLAGSDVNRPLVMSRQPLRPRWVSRSRAAAVLRHKKELTEAYDGREQLLEMNMHTAFALSGYDLVSEELVRLAVA